MNRGKTNKIALSAVLSTFLISGLNAQSLSLYEDNQTINKVEVQTGTAFLNSGTISGAITAGAYVDGNSSYHPETHNAIGQIVGVDVNESATDLNNSGTINIGTSTLSSYTPNGGTTQYPDQNNTTLASASIKVSNSLERLINTGTISSSMSLNNDTNNTNLSDGGTVGVVINSTITKGIINTGTIIATATAQDRLNSNNTPAIGSDDEESVEILRVGGHTGTSGTKNTIKDLPQKARYQTSINDVSKVGDDSKLVQADSAIYSDKLQASHDHYASQMIDTKRQSLEYVHEMVSIRTDNTNTSDTNTHMHEGVYTPADDKYVAATYGDGGKIKGDLNNNLFASGIKVNAEVTGGITNHGYISSIDTDAEVKGDSSDGSKVGITVTPNLGDLPAGTTSGKDPNDAKTDDEIETDVNNSIDSNTSAAIAALHNDGFQNINASDANGSIATNYSFPYNGEANGDMTDDNNFSDIVKTSIDQQLQADYTDQNQTIVSGGAVETAVNNLTDNIRKAYLKAPADDNTAEAPAEANTSIGTLPPADAGAFASGSHTARVGNMVLNANTTGAAGADAIVVRASSTTNFSDRITSDGNLTASDGVDGRANSDANVTAGNVQAYVGEGSADRNISLSGNKVTNNLIGGINNNAQIQGGAGNSGIKLTTDATSEAHSDNNLTITQYNQEDIDGAPSSKVGIGHILNTADIKGGDGGSGIELKSRANSGITAEETISGHELHTDATSITNVRDLFNIGNIKGGMGGSGIDGEATTIGLIKATDINNTEGNSTQTTGIKVTTHADATFGNILNVGEISTSLGKDGVQLNSDGKAGVNANTVTNSIVQIDTTTVGGVRKVAGKAGDTSLDTEGNFLNAGTIKVSLSKHAVDMHSDGLATLKDKDGAPATAVVTSSDVKVKNTSITGVEGNFVNGVITDINNTTLEKINLTRGEIKASLAEDAVHMDTNGVADYDAASTTTSSVNIENHSTSGVGENFANYGDIKVALAKNGVNLSSDSKGTLGKADTSTITSSTVTVKNYSKSGTGKRFINGASAIETGELKEHNVSVHNPTATDSSGNTYYTKDTSIANQYYYTVAAQENENNTSDTNSSGAHTNHVLSDSTVKAYDKEASITSATIKAALAADAVKFEATNVGTLKVKEINSTSTTRIDTEDGDATYETLSSSRSNVSLLSKSDSSVGSDFINNGAITVALSKNGVNGNSTATGTLGDKAHSVISNSDVNQTTISRAGVQGNFINEAVSREVGEAKAFTAVDSNGWFEVAAFTYDRATNVGDVKITSALAKNAVTLESNAQNKIDIKDTKENESVLWGGSQGTDFSTNFTLSSVKDKANDIKSNIYSETTSTAGVDGNFSSTGLIKASLAQNGFDAQTIGNTNVVGDSTDTMIYGADITSVMNSTAGVGEDFTNDIQSLKTGEAKLIYKDVFDYSSDRSEKAPRYYDHTDDKEGQRVKSNVVDRVVYNRELAEGEIKTALAADAILLDADGKNSIVAAKITTKNVDVVTNQTGGDTTDDNATEVTRVETIKVTSTVNSTSTVTAGIGGKFTNKSKISASLAKNALTANANGTTEIGDGTSANIDGGEVTATTIVKAGVGHGNTGNNGFLNAADSYDDGDVQVGTSKVISGYNDETHTLLAANANDNIDENVTSLHLIDSKDVIFWNKSIKVAEIKSSLAKDAVKLDGKSTTAIKTISIAAATGDVNLTADDEIISVQGHYVEGRAKAKVTASTTTYAGVEGNFINQGAIKSSLATDAINTKGEADGQVTDVTAHIIGSDVNQTTAMTAGVHGWFKNEVLSLDKDNGEVYTKYVDGVETPYVAFDKETTDGKVEISTALAKTAVMATSKATNKVISPDIKASGAVEDSYSYVSDESGRTIGTIKSDALNAKSTVTSSTTSTAGISDGFYNTGVIKASLAKEAIDTRDDSSTNTLGDGGESITGSDVTANMTSYAGIRGDFTNDTVSLDDGAKTLVQADVINADGTPVYHLSADDSQNGAGTRVKSNVIARVDYGKKIVEGEIKTSLAGDAINADAAGVVTDVKPDVIGTADVRVVKLKDSNSQLISEADDNLTIKVTSDTTTSTYVKAGIGGKFANYSSKGIHTSLAKNAITAIANGTTTVDTATEIVGGTTTATTTVIAGIGNNFSNDSAHRGFLNGASSYDETLHEYNTTIASNNTDGHDVISADANDAVATDANNSLPLIDSENVAVWDKVVKVASIKTSLAQDALNLETTSTGTVASGGDIKSATNDVNVTTNGVESIEALRGYHVAGTARANVSQTTTTYAGVYGGFVNNGAIETSLAGNVLNTKATAIGTIGKAATTITDATVESDTYATGGIQNGGFRNEVLSLNTTGHLATQLSGTESAKIYYDKETTDGKTLLKAALSEDVLLLDGTSTNSVIPATITAGGAIIGSDSDDIMDALLARSVVRGNTYTKTGIDGNFYNSGIIESATAKNVLTSHATSTNAIGSGSETITGSKVTATSKTDARIVGSFTNDAVLLDDGSATLTMKKESVDNNDSNVADTITYDQKIVKGKLKSGTGLDVLSMVATGGNSIDLLNVDNKTVKVVTIGTDEKSSSSAMSSHSANDVNVSSSLTATNEALSGITGKFTNAADIESAAGTDALNFQALGGKALVKVATALEGGDITTSNRVISGINLDGNSSTVGFLNDKRDFNTVLATDAGYATGKVVTGTIKTDAAQMVINMIATGDVENDITMKDTNVQTTNDNNTYDSATVDNTNTNLAAIQGKFINKGELSSGGAGNILNFVATNSGKNDIDTINDKGFVTSKTTSNVKTFISGDVDNSGLISSTSGKALNLVADAGATPSKIIGTLSDQNLTEWAGQNGKLFADNSVNTYSFIGKLTNSGIIEGATAINLDGKGKVDSSGFDLGTVTQNATNVVIKDKVDTIVSIGSILNTGTIKSKDTSAEAIKASSTAEAKTSANGDATKETYEDTTANVVVSLGDITNKAWTYHNIKKDVNKAFNTDHNDSTDDQLKPEYATVIANNGQYDFATGDRVERNASLYSTSDELNAYAYNDNNSSDNPVLSQTVGKIEGLGAIALSSTATEEKFANAYTTVGNITNTGIIDGKGGIGISLSSDGDAAKGAVAHTTAGVIKNDIAHDTFDGKDGKLHALLLGEIKGVTAIKLDAVGAADENVSITTVNQIQNRRVVLNKGDLIVSSADDAKDGKVTKNGDDFNNVTSVSDNYKVTALDRDTVYSAVISGTTASIEVGENAHVTNGIHNWGTITGDVKLGDADIYLYGLMDNNTTDSGNLNDLLLTQEQFDADTHTQVAGIVDGNINTAFAGSSIVMEDAHIFKDSPTWSADEIVIDSGAVANIASDTTFALGSVADPLGKGFTKRFTNKGILNVRAGKTTNITGGDYLQSGNGYFLDHLIGSAIVDGDNVHDTANAEFGVLNVSGDATFNGAGIKIVVDGNKTDAEWTALATSGVDTILKGVVVAGSVDNNTTANTTKGSAVNVTVTDNLTTVNFKAIQGDNPGTIDLILEAAITGKPLMTGDLVHVQQTIMADFGDLVSTRLDQTTGYGIDFSRSLRSDSAEGTDRNWGEGVKTRWLSFKDRLVKNLKERNYWVKPFVSKSKQDATSSGNTGYDANAYGIALGTDRDYLNGWRSGFAFAFAKSSVDSKSDLKHSNDADVFQLIGYTSKQFAKRTVLNLQLGYGLMKNDGRRTDSTTGDIYTSKFDTKVIQAKAELERAYDSIFKNTTIIPYGKVVASKIDSDGYTESGNVAGALKVDGYSANSFLVGAGVKTRYDLPNYEATFVTHAGLGYDFAAKSINVQSEMLSGAPSETAKTDDPEKLELDLGLGLQYKTKHGNKFLLSYDFKGRKNYQNHVGSLKFIFAFGK